ncbi:MAG: hypothetical protein R3C14_44805 [Caldilineaceae bacterium]
MNFRTYVKRHVAILTLAALLALTTLVGYGPMGTLLGADSVPAVYACMSTGGAGGC